MNIEACDGSEAPTFALVKPYLEQHETELQALIAAVPHQRDDDERDKVKMRLLLHAARVIKWAHECVYPEDAAEVARIIAERGGE